MDLYFKGHSRQREIIISFGISFFFAFIGPFGTYDNLSFLYRLLYWTIIIFGCGALFWATIYLVKYFSLFSNLSNLKRHFIIILLFSFPASFIVHQVNSYFRQVNLSLFGWFIVWVAVFTITLGITYLIFFSNIGKIQSKKEKKEVDENINIFFEKLPKKLGKELISLTSHDHYIEVQTNIGKTMIYFRFRDAVSLLEKYPGTQIHRSHWVSFSAIKNMKLNGRKKFVTLFDGRILPVSDKYKKKLHLMDLQEFESKQR